MRSLRILLTVHQYERENSKGTEIIVHDAAEELTTRGHEVRIYSGSVSEANVGVAVGFENVVIDGVPVRRIVRGDPRDDPRFDAVAAEYDDPLAREDFARVLSEFRPDVVHAFHLGRISASIIDACRAADVPFVMTPTDFWLICVSSQLRLPDGTSCAGPDADGVNCVRHIVSTHYPEPWRRRVAGLSDAEIGTRIRLAARGVLPSAWLGRDVRSFMRRKSFLESRLPLVDAFLVPSRVMFDTFVRLPVERERIRLVPYGIRPPGGGGSRPDPAAPALRIGFIGAIAEHKGPHLLIEAVNDRLGNLPLDVELHGPRGEDASFVASLERRAANDPRVSIHGTFPSRDVGRILARFHALVIPSLWRENTPLVLLSARAVGCPVIASDVDGIKEAVRPGVDGLLCPIGDAGALAEAIRKLHEDRALLAEMGRDRTTVRSMTDYAADIESVYAEAIEARRKRRAANR